MCLISTNCKVFSPWKRNLEISRNSNLRFKIPFGEQVINIIFSLFLHFAFVYTQKSVEILKAFLSVWSIRRLKKQKQQMIFQKMSDSIWIHDEFNNAFYFVSWPRDI